MSHYSEKLNELALFAGAGGGILGGHLLGWRTVCAVERDRYAASILAQRQNDGLLRPFPIWDDVCTFDGEPWRGIVDVVSGGFPCQDISVAGTGLGLSGERSGLWREFARIIGQIRPRFVFVENSPALISRGLDVVLSDLYSFGYDAAWITLGAVDVGAPHKRDRIWILGQISDSVDNRQRKPIQSLSEQRSNLETDSRSDGQVQYVADSSRIGGKGLRLNLGGFSSSRQGMSIAKTDGHPWASGDPAERESDSQSFLGRVANGLANRVDRLRAIGNGQVPLVAAVAWCELRRILDRERPEKPFSEDQLSLE